MPRSRSHVGRSHESSAPVHCTDISGQVAAILAADVSAGVVGVYEGDAVLCDLLHRSRGAVRAVTAVYVGVHARQLSGVRAALRHMAKSC